MMRTRNVITGLIVAFVITAFAVPNDAHAQPDQVAGQATFGNLIAALNNISVQIEELEALNDVNVEDVNVVLVNVDDLLRGANVEAFNNALNRNDVDINILRDFLNDSVNNNVVEVIKNSLNDNFVVVAVDVLSGGDIIVYYQEAEE